jgi:UTP--glucose-1-phosphate uridylyltransferase
MNLTAKGDKERLAKVMASSELANIHYVRQGDPKGLGHAVLRAKAHIADNSFALLLGDDVMDARDVLLTKMLAVHESTGENVVALMEVSPDQIHLYGCAVTDGEIQDGVVRITGLVEKPKNEEAPSNLAVIGRYVLRPEIFDILEETEPGRGGEIQLTDALMTAAQNPERAGGVLGVVFQGRRYDTGDKLDFIKATLRLGVDREDIGADLRSWLQEFNSKI